MHRLPKTGKETVDMGVSCVVDGDVGVAVLCTPNRLEGSSYTSQGSLCYEPRTFPPATFSELILQAISCAELISSGQWIPSPFETAWFSCVPWTSQSAARPTSHVENKIKTTCLIPGRATSQASFDTRPPSTRLHCVVYSLATSSVKRRGSAEGERTFLQDNKAVSRENRRV